MGLPIVTVVVTDVVLIAATALVAHAAWQHRRAAYQLGIGEGIVWVLAGLMATIVFYVFDLLEVSGMHLVASPSRAEAIEKGLLLHWSWIHRLVADGAILAGLWYLVRVLLPRASADRLELESSQQALARELAACQRAEDRLRELQGKVLLAERLSTAEEFAGSVAHSINNPLTALIGALSVAHEAGPTRELIDTSLRTARRIKEFVRHLTQLFRTGALDLSACNPRALLESVRSELESSSTSTAGGSGIQIVLEVDDDLHPLWIDRTLISLALQCIGANGLEAMEAGGGTLTLRARALPRVEGIRIEISDSGPGVPPDDRARIFEPFFTTKSHSSGLGLAIAHGVVKGHGGAIRISEASGGGALFSVILPSRPNGASLRVQDREDGPGLTGSGKA